MSTPPNAHLYKLLYNHASVNRSGSPSDKYFDHLVERLGYIVPKLESIDNYATSYPRNSLVITTHSHGEKVNSHAISVVFSDDQKVTVSAHNFNTLNLDKAEKFSEELDVILLDYSEATDAILATMEKSDLLLGYIFKVYKKGEAELRDHLDRMNAPGGPRAWS